MKTVKFYENADNSKLKFAVIVSKYRGRRVFCKHKARDTFECPGGRREAGETIEDTAKRELWEETGAEAFTLNRVSAYSVSDDGGNETFGMLYFAEITVLGALPAFEIERIELFDAFPDRWTYPEIQPILIQKAEETAARNCES